MRFSAGTRRSSKKSSVVAWFIMVRIGLMLMPVPCASRMSTRNTERPSLRRVTASRGVVRARSRRRSECSARDVQIFWPLMM